MQGENRAGHGPKGASGGRPNYVNAEARKLQVYGVKLPVREQRNSPQLWNRSPEELVNLDGMLTGRGWVERSPSAHQASPSDTANFDTSMSDNNSEAQKSSGHTSSATHSSSNTSYSSPHEENIDHVGPAASHPRTHDPAGLSAAASTPGIFSLSSADEVQYPLGASPRLQNNGGLNDRQAWPLGSSNELLDRLTSASPSTEAAWAQLLEGGFWDGTQVGDQNTVRWTG